MVGAFFESTSRHPRVRGRCHRVPSDFSLRRGDNVLPISRALFLISVFVYGVSTSHGSGPSIGGTRLPIVPIVLSGIRGKAREVGCLAFSSFFLGFFVVFVKGYYGATGSIVSRTRVGTLHDFLFRGVRSYLPRRPVVSGRVFGGGVFLHLFRFPRGRQGRVISCLGVLYDYILVSQGSKGVQGVSKLV